MTLDSSVMNVSIATVTKDFFSRRIPTRQPGASTANSWISTATAPTSYTCVVSASGRIARMGRRVLFTSPAGLGHIHPMVPLARAMVARGHEVLWAVPADGVDHVERTGIGAVAVAPAGLTSVTDVRQRYPELDALPPLEVGDVMFGKLFGAMAAPHMLAGLAPVALEWRPDLVVADAAEFAGHIMAAELGVVGSVTVGPKADPAVVGAQPAHVRVEQYVPQTLVLPHCDVVVSHAGSGTVLAALAVGVAAGLPAPGRGPVPRCRCRLVGGSGRLVRTGRAGSGRGASRHRPRPR